MLHQICQNGPSLICGLDLRVCVLAEGCYPWYLLELQTKVREDFTITKKAPTWAYSWLKAFTFKTILKTLSKTRVVPW